LLDAVSFDFMTIANIEGSRIGQPVPCGRCFWLGLLETGAQRKIDVPGDQNRNLRGEIPARSVEFKTRSNRGASRGLMPLLVIILKSEAKPNRSGRRRPRVKSGGEARKPLDEVVTISDQTEAERVRTGPDAGIYFTSETLI